MKSEIVTEINNTNIKMMEFKVLGTTLITLLKSLDCISKHFRVKYHFFREELK